MSYTARGDQGVSPPRHILTCLFWASWVLLSTAHRDHGYNHMHGTRRVLGQEGGKPPQRTSKLLATATSLPSTLTHRAAPTTTRKLPGPGVNGVSFCGAKPGTAAERALAEERFQAKMKHIMSQSRSRKANLFEMTTVDVHFHGLVDSTTGEGNVTAGQVNSQIDILNEAFRAHGFQFRCVPASYAACECFARESCDEDSC